MRWAICLLGVQVMAAVRLEPSTPKQGDVIRVTADAPAVSAKFKNRVISLYPQPSGAHFGLMPVSANDRPGAYALQVADAGGAIIESVRVVVKDARFPKQNVRLSRRVQALKPSPGEMETVAAFRKAVSPVRQWQEPFELPVPGCLTSPFGVRRLYNGKPSGNYHGGLDQASDAGTPIRVIASGVVRLVREYNVHGHVVGVDHGQGLSSLYLHMSRFEAAEGKTVQKGDVIGYAGSTGRSTAPHLHWSVYVNGVAVNPAQWVTPPPCTPR